MAMAWRAVLAIAIHHTLAGLDEYSLLYSKVSINIVY
jgi:hypothetical protein